MMMVVMMMKRRAFRTMLGVCGLLMAIAASLRMGFRRTEIKVRSGRTNPQTQKQGNQEECVHQADH
jgi:hypothetical protein